MTEVVEGGSGSSSSNAKKAAGSKHAGDPRSLKASAKDQPVYPANGLVIERGTSRQ